MHLIANISLLFKEVSLPDRFRAARNAGFDGVEILFPYGENLTALAQASRDEDMPIHLINSPPGNRQAGELGFAALPGAAFQEGLEQASDAATRLGAKHVHLMTGYGSGASAMTLLSDNLQRAARSTPELTFLLEPLNPITFPGYALSSLETAAQILRATDSSNVGLQFDTFHASMLGHDLAESFAAHADIIRHIQIARPPDRGEPDIPAMADLWEAIRGSDYTGAIAAEYAPAGATGEGLAWVQDFRRLAL